MSEDSLLQITLASIGVFGAIMTAIVGRLSIQVGRVRTDAAATRKLATRTDHSINNRDTPLSDRLDDVKGVAQAALDAVGKVAETQDEHTRDIRGIRQDMGIMTGVDRGLREDIANTQRNLSAHVTETRRTIELADKTASTVRQFLPLLDTTGTRPEQN
jgi:hypothetical protein